MKLKTLLLLMAFAAFTPAVSFAAPTINTEDQPAGLISMHEMVADKALTTKELKVLKQEERKQLRMERRMARLEKFMNSKMGQKLLGGLSDPVDKFFWYWVIGWGVGIVFSILAAATLLSGGFSILWLIAYLAYLAGSVSLIVWLVKKFS